MIHDRNRPGDLIDVRDTGGAGLATLAASIFNTAPASEPQLLDVEGACRSTGMRHTLRGASLQLARGELVALLGPNGAGKSTLLRAIAGRLPLDAGRIRVAGHAPGTPAARRRTGLVPQSIALHAQLSVRANLEIFGRLAGVAGADLGRAVEEALDWTGLADRAGESVRTLSGGMQRRVNIAAGTLHAPDLLLLDEPAVGLDPIARTQVHEVLLRLRSRAMAMLLTTHDLHEAEALADRVAIMRDGQIARMGSVAVLVREVFGDRRELCVRLAADPLAVTQEALAAADLTGTANPRVWIGAVNDDLHELSTLRNRLQSAGAVLDGLEVRNAGLHGVYLRLTGEELPT